MTLESRVKVTPTLNLTTAQNCKVHFPFFTEDVHIMHINYLWCVDCNEVLDTSITIESKVKVKYV